MRTDPVHAADRVCNVSAETLAKPVARSACSDPADVQSVPASEIELPKFLRILLVEADQDRAEGIAMQLRDVFGERCSREWVDDPAQAVEFMQKNAHDIYLARRRWCGGIRREMVRSSIGAGCGGPIIVLSGNSDTQSDVAAVAAGAADYHFARRPDSGPARPLHPPCALPPSGQAARARSEIEALTTEKTRLNLLREANHRFVENACHDFRSPLTVIKEFASIIAEGLSGEVNEEQAEFLQIILTRVDHLSSMVDGILDASRLESDVIGVRREEQTVAKLIEQAKTDARAARGRA